MISAAFRGGAESTRRAALFVLRFVLPALSCLGCSTPREAASPPPGPPPPPPTAVASAASFGIVELDDLPGAIALDDASRWQAINGGSFTVLEHVASRSRLSLRLWRAARLVRPAECEAEARVARPSLPRVDLDAVIDSRPLDAPQGFTGSVVVAVDGTPSGSTRGFVLAVGAAVGRCFVLVFETSADGVNAAHVVGNRLRQATDVVVPSVELRSIDERVRPDRDL
jgi:hypothetical protein